MPKHEHQEIQRVSLADFRERMADLLAEVQYKGEHFMLTRHGKPVAAVVSADDYARFLKLVETFEDSLDAQDSVAPPDEKTLSLDDALRKL